MLGRNELLAIINRQDLNFNDLANLESHVLYIKGLDKEGISEDLKLALIVDLEMIVERLTTERKKLAKKRLRIVN